MTVNVCPNCRLPTRWFPATVTNPELGLRGPPVDAFIMAMPPFAAPASLVDQVAQAGVLPWFWQDLTNWVRGRGGFIFDHSLG